MELSWKWIEKKQYQNSPNKDYKKFRWKIEQIYNP